MESIASVGTATLQEGRIKDVININRVWLIPKEAQKPADGRLKESNK